MTTNLTRENFLVLTNSENKIVAIIQCEKGKQDISEKVIQAISADYDSEVSILTDETELNDYDYEFEFNAVIKGDDDYEDIETFTFTFAHVY